MPVTINATPGDPDANSYDTLQEVNDYFDARIPLNPPWNPATDPASRAIVTATRTIDSLASGRRRLVKPASGDAYYIVGRKWTGTPATSTQALAWPRIGMYDRNGNPIPADVIPRELKEATAELSGQLQQTDRTLDNAVSAQGIKSISAGSVSVAFKDDIDVKVLSDMVLNLMPPSWFTEETIEGATSVFDFEVI